ncbi:MAG: 1,4-dihydroxy-2-naphthoate polyprenyltransferase [Micrococcaceae bacterium]
MSQPTIAQWIEGARLRTIPLSLAPVIAGSALAYEQGSFQLDRALLCLFVALLLQVGVNYANDYSDGIKGTDDNRVGPLRLTGSGIAKPEQVKCAMYISFALAGLLGIILVVISGTWWMLIVGVISIAAAWGYTGGKKPYGYLGLGEIFVFVFFGLVATLGTQYVQSYRINELGVVLAISIGLFACAVLVANNLRDIPTDAEVGKNTLAVRLGEDNTRIMYLAMMIIPYLLITIFVIIDTPWLALSYLSIVLAYQPCKIVLNQAKGLDLIPVLKLTGFVSVAYSLLVTLGLALN